ncbi:MAG: hypothetical protein QOG52_1858, partial [Frankiaceae bacterium]|nr:hypothetical protein [Frankiaceae bacterium]
MRRIAVLIAFVFGFVSLAVPASAATKIKITVTASSGAVAPKVAYRVSGHVVPAAVRPVVLQHLVGAAWKNVATGKSDKRGGFTLAVTPTVAGTWLLRVQTLSGKVVLATSGVVTLHVRTASSVITGFTFLTSYVGSAAPMTGVVSPNEAGRAVSLQQLVAGVWKPVAVTVTTAGGAFAFDAPTTTAGTLSFRVAVAASVKRAAVVGATLPLTVGPALVGHGVVLVDDNGHVTTHELGGTMRDISLPIADEDNGSFAANGRILAVSGTSAAATAASVIGPGFGPVLLVKVGAGACVSTWSLSANGHAAGWITGTADATGCTPTAAFVRDLDAGVTSSLAVDAAAFAGANGLSITFDHDGNLVEVSISPKVAQVPTFSFNELYTLRGVPVPVSGKVGMGELGLVYAAAPAGHITAFDYARGEFVSASLTSSARPVRLTQLPLYDLVG